MFLYALCVEAIMATLSVIHPNKTFNVPMLLCFLLFLTNAAVSLFIPPPCYLHFGLASRSFGTVCLCRSLSDIHCWAIRTASIAGSSSCCQRRSLHECVGGQFKGTLLQYLPIVVQTIGILWKIFVFSSSIYIYCNEQLKFY